jgi:hypothetical protein
MVETSPVSQRAPLENDNQEDAMESLALLLLGRPRKAPQERLEAVPVPIQSD